jgi:hypothetical protein
MENLSVQTRNEEAEIDTHNQGRTWLIGIGATLISYLSANQTNHSSDINALQFKLRNEEAETDKPPIKEEPGGLA